VLKSAGNRGRSFIFRLRVLAAVAILVGISVAAVLSTSGSRDGFCLVTVYEASTHALDGEGAGLRGAGARDASVNGRTLNLKSLPSMIRLCRLGIVRETYHAGQGVSVFLYSVLGKSRIKIGSSNGPSVFDDDLVLSVDREGRVDIVFREWRKSLPPGEGTSFIAFRDERGGRLIEEDSQMSQDQISTALEHGTALSRLIVYNHGMFTRSQVRQVAP
jgi:hypothetical protein